MTPEFGKPIHQLPLIPANVLKKHRVHEPLDKRFRTASGAKGVALRILNMNLDTNDATGKLMLQIIGSIAEFERSIMLARQSEGIAKAKAEGKYRGGIPTARAKAEQIFALVDAGKTRAEAAEDLERRTLS
jgi:Resolvase, N terminal domain